MIKAIYRRNATIIANRVERWQLFCVGLERKLIHIAVKMLFAPREKALCVKYVIPKV
jgi:hypothetical protein